MGFFEALGRPFNPVVDWSYFGSAEGLLSDSIGRRGAIVSVILLAILAVATVVFTLLSVLRLAKLLHRHRTTSIRAVAVLAVVWVLCAAFGARIVSDAPVASTSAASLAYEQVSRVRASIRDEHTFAKGLTVDPLHKTPAANLLTGLRGKDVI